MMEDEKEMLERAAKAYGLKNFRYFPESDGLLSSIEYDDENDCTVVWMPHLDDGDALRLAVKLRISLIHEQEYIGAPVLETVEAITAPISGDGKRTCMTECINEQGCNEMARVRLAIVRAAASMVD